MVSFEEKVKGVLISTAYGDALGASVEKLTFKQIQTQYGYVNDLKTKWYKEDLGPEVNLGRSRGNGTITDDTLMTLALCRVYEKERRHLDAYDLGNEFVKEIAFRKTYVPELRKDGLIIDRLFYPEKHIFLRHVLANCDPREGGYGNMVNCGAAMYIAPIGVVNAGNPRAAYEEAISFATGHQVSYGLEAAGVLSACVAKAFEDEVTIKDIIETALQFSKDGTHLAIKDITELAYEIKDKDLSYEEIVRAFQLALKQYSPMEDDVHRKIEKVGIPSNHYTPSRLFSIEELPMALGMLILNDGNFKKTIADCINSGRDTDSIGVMAGVILGAIYGSSVIDQDDISLLEETNRIDFNEVSKRFSIVAREIISEDIRVSKIMETIIK